MIIIVFLIASLFSLLPVLHITGKYTYSPSHGVCFAEWHPVNEVFRSIFYSIVIGLAFPVLIICYFLLYRALRRSNKNITENHKEDTQVGCTGEQGVIENPHPCEDQGRYEGIVSNDTNHASKDDSCEKVRNKKEKPSWKKKISFPTPLDIQNKIKVRVLKIS